MSEYKKKKRGFAAMDIAKRKSIARRGGFMAHKLGVAHRFSRDEAIAAGRKGGLNRHKNDRTENQ